MWVSEISHFPLLLTARACRDCCGRYYWKISIRHLTAPTQSSHFDYMWRQKWLIGSDLDFTGRDRAESYSNASPLTIIQTYIWHYTIQILLLLEMQLLAQPVNVTLLIVLILLCIKRRPSGIIQCVKKNSFHKQNESLKGEFANTGIDACTLLLSYYSDVFDLYSVVMNKALSLDSWPFFTHQTKQNVFIQKHSPRLCSRSM